MPALESSGRFFAALRNEIGQVETSAFTDSQKSNLRSLIDQRDALTALFSRSDPAAVERLTDFVFSVCQRVKVS